MTPTKKKRGRKLWVPPAGIDWCRPAMHIAKDCGVSIGTVISCMRRSGLPVRPVGVQKGTQFTQLWSVDPSTIDWRYRDTALAFLHGVSRERIRQIRKAKGLPASGSKAWREQGGVTETTLV